MAPGIGRTIALLMVSEINDIKKRFRSNRKLYALYIVT
jgi:transposase